MTNYLFRHKFDDLSIAANRLVILDKDGGPLHHLDTLCLKNASFGRNQQNYKLPSLAENEDKANKLGFES